MLLAIGGQDNNPSSSKKTSSIHALSLSLRAWLHVGDVPFECSLVDSVVLPGGGGLGVIDGAGRQMVQGSVKGECVHGYMCVHGDMFIYLVQQ